MCGISGIVNFSNNQINIKNLIYQMTQSIKHRGPDDEGFVFISNSEILTAGGDDTPQEVWNSSFPYSPKIHINAVRNNNYNIALGHRRLSIIDLSAAGHQPMCSEDKKVWIVYNGEIYNYIELRDELKSFGYTFNTNSDTEVVLAAYEEWGFDCLNKFNGMWAFVIYDSRKNILFGSRDRFGVKPLYYIKKDNYFSFASEIKSLLRLPFIKREINEKVVFYYFITGLEEYQQESFFKDILEFNPSNYFIFDLNSNEFKVFKYYELKFQKDFEDFEEKKALKFSQKIKELIFNAIKLRLRSDVPVGTCLSGGLDSSTVVCVINKFLNEKFLTQVGDRQKVFTASFPDKNIDETFWAKIVVDSTNTEWYQTFPKLEELLQDLEELVYYQDIPFPSTSIYSQYRVMKLAKENGIKVLLDGQGGDEVFAGYRHHYQTYLAELLKNMRFKDFLSECFKVSEKFNFIIEGILRNFVLIFFPPFLKQTGLKIKNPILNYLNGDFLKSNITRISLQKSSKNLNECLYKDITYLNLKLLLRYEDRNSMRFSIEARTPFSDDINLIEYLFQIPSSYKIHNGWTKYLLRLSMEGILPKKIQLRRDKIGFATPEKEWLIKNSRYFKEIISGKISEFFDEKKLKDKWDEIVKIQPENITPLWRIINFSLWRDVYKV